MRSSFALPTSASERAPRLLLLVAVWLSLASVATAQVASPRRAQIRFIVQHDADLLASEQRAIPRFARALRTAAGGSRRADVSTGDATPLEAATIDAWRSEQPIVWPSDWDGVDLVVACRLGAPTTLPGRRGALVMSNGVVEWVVLAPRDRRVTFESRADGDVVPVDTSGNFTPLGVALTATTASWIMGAAGPLPSTETP